MYRVERLVIPASSIFLVYIYIYFNLYTDWVTRLIGTIYLDYVRDNIYECILIKESDCMYNYVCCCMYDCVSHLCLTKSLTVNLTIYWYVYLTRCLDICWWQYICLYISLCVSLGSLWVILNNVEYIWVFVNLNDFE